MNPEQTPQLSLQELAFELAQAVKILIGDIKSKPNDTRYLTSLKVGANALLKYDEFRFNLTSPATVSGDEINIEKSRIEGVLLGLKICKEMWAQGTMSHENIYENEVIYKEELKNILDKQTPVSGKEVEGVKFNVGDKINLNTGYSCDIGIVEKYENGIVYWKNSLGDTLYNTPVDKYNITIIKKATTPIKETVTDGVESKNK